MVPEGWSEKRLEDVFKLGSGDGRPSDVVPERSEEMPVPVYGGNGILGFTASYNVDRPTIVIGRVGEYCGVTRFFSGKCWITDNALYAKAVVPDVDIEFLAYRLQEFNLARLRSKGGQPLVSQKPIYAQKLSFPPKSEQVKIVELLRLWDCAIDVVEKLIESSRVKSRAVTRALLPPDKVLGNSNDDQWRFVRLGAIGATYGGLTGKSKADFGSGKPYIPYKNVFENSVIDLSNLDYVRVAADESQSLVASGDIVFTTSSETPEEVGMSSVVLSEPEQLYLNSFCFGFRVFEKGVMAPEFARFFFRSAPVRRRIVSLAQGSTRYNLSTRRFLELSFALPPFDEQMRIAQILSDARQIEEASCEYAAALRKERDALMHQLLTGKRRIKVEAVQ